MGFPPSHPTRIGGLGERRKQGPGLAPAENEFGTLWSCQKDTGGSHLEYLVLVGIGGG